MKAYRYVMVAMAMAALATGCANRGPSTPTPLPGISAATSFELDGEIFGPADSPVEGVEVTLSQGDENERQAVSDADGKFRIGGLEAGEWTATLKCKGYTDRSLKVVVNGNVTISFDLLPAL